MSINLWLGNCSRCGNQKEFFYTDYSICAPAEHQKYTCPHCALRIFLPNVVIRQEWLRWQSSHKDTITSSKYLQGLVAMIESQLHKAVVKLEPMQLTCPKCQRNMAYNQDDILCKKCGEISMTPGEYAGDLVTDLPKWP